jgi:outer membrane protein TolC
MGLENNLDVEIGRHAPLVADEDLSIAWGAYDPNVTGEFGYLKSASPPGSGPLSPPLQKQDGSVGVAGILPWVGASYGIDFLADRTESTGFFTGFNPEFNSSLQFSGTLPLLKGLVWNAPWTTVHSNALLRDSSYEDFRASVMTTVRDIEASYWTLVAEIEQMRVARKSLETAHALLGQVTAQFEVGVVSKVEVIEGEAGVAERDVNLIRAENAYRRAQDLLIDAVLGPHLTASSTLNIEPSDHPDDYVAYDVDVQGAADRAVANRPELRAAELEVARSELQLKYRRNQRLPQLDFQGSYKSSAISGREKPKIADGDALSGTTLGESIDSLFGPLDGPSWSVRGVVSIPLGNVAGRHEVSKAGLELRRAKVQLARTHQAIILEVRDGTRNLLSARRGIEAAERRRAAAQEQLRAERVRLEHGESTPFDVLQRERDLVDAESQKINALRLYRTSEADLLRAQGTILEARNVIIDDVMPLR